MRNHGIRFLTLVIALTLALTSATFAQKVRVDYEKGHNFSQYKTYYWAKVETPNSLWEERVKKGVDAQLRAKSWQKVDAGGDVAIASLITTQQQQTLNTFYSGLGGGWGYRGFGGMGSATTTTSTYRTGTLIVDIFDAKTKTLEWRAVADDDISDNPEKNQKKLAKSITKMFEKFPPKS